MPKTTPLNLAVISGDHAKVKSLLRAGANVHEVDDNGCSALLCAVFCGFTPILELLLLYGADPNSKLPKDSIYSGPRRSALDVAIINGFPFCVEMLLLYHADPNVRNERGVTSLIQAAQIGRADIVQILLDRGAKANEKCNEKKFTAYDWAIRCEHDDVANILRAYNDK